MEVLHIWIVSVQCITGGGLESHQRSKQFHSLPLHIGEMKTCLCETCMRTFKTTLNWKQPKYPSVTEGINKLQPIHSMGSDAVIKQNKLPK